MRVKEPVDVSAIVLLLVITFNAPKAKTPLTPKVRLLLLKVNEFPLSIVKLVNAPVEVVIEFLNVPAPPIACALLIM